MMCDIYSHKCKFCGDEIEMHLGDYETDRDEIEVVCDKCLRKEIEKNLPVYPFELFPRLRRSFWLYASEEDWSFKLAMIVSLTENAWENRGINHPNFSLVALLGHYDAEQEG